MADDSTPDPSETDEAVLGEVIQFVTAEELASKPKPPVVDLGPGTGEVAMPHWTAPATGQVPQVVLGAGVDPSDPSGSAIDSPNWRDEHDTSDDADFMRDLASLDPDEPVVERLGALDTSDRSSDEDYLNFDDVQLDPTRSGRTRVRRTRTGRGAARPARTPASTPGERVATDATDGSDSGDAPTPRPGGRNVPLAAAVGLAMAAVALVAFAMGPAMALIIVELVVVAAGVEFLGALQRNGYRPATLLGVAAIAVFPLATYWKGEAAFPLILALTLVFGIAWFVFGVGGRARPVPNLGVTLLSVIWIGMFGAFAALILKTPAQGVSILLLAVLGTVGSDVGAFFIGRAAGRTPLSAVSPNKTVEGLIGGVVGSILLIFIAAVIVGVGPFSAGGALLLSVVIAVIAPLGDLAESLFKRDLGIKDMGTLLPQHGGILDRFDGMLFVLPATYYVARVCGLVA